MSKTCTAKVLKRLNTEHEFSFKESECKELLKVVDARTNRCSKVCLESSGCSKTTFDEYEMAATIKGELEKMEATIKGELEKMEPTIERKRSASIVSYKKEGMKPSQNSEQGLKTSRVQNEVNIDTQYSIIKEEEAFKDFRQRVEKEGKIPLEQSQERLHASERLKIHLEQTQENEAKKLQAAKEELKLVNEELQKYKTNHLPKVRDDFRNQYSAMESQLQQQIEELKDKGKHDKQQVDEQEKELQQMKDQLLLEKEGQKEQQLKLEQSVAKLKSAQEQVATAQGNAKTAAKKLADAKKDAKNDETATGIIVGVSVLALCIVCVLLWVMCCRKKDEKSEQSEEDWDSDWEDDSESEE